MTNTSDSWVRLEIADGIATLTLNRPETLNAMTPDLMATLRDTIKEAEEREDVRVLVVTGAGRAFSSGGDKDFLNDLNAMSATQIKNVVYACFQGAVKALKLCSKPTIAAVNGAAVGAGCELALAADFRLASSDAYFLESWVQLGIIAPLGGMTLLPQLIGLGRASEMLMLGRKVGGEEAERIGLVTRSVATAEFPGEVARLARQLADGPPLAYQVFKEGLRRGAETSLAAEWESNLHAQAILIGSDDFAEAVRAAGASERPKFTGT
jgi:enoyl-CoA hydratase/carnithine racemase